MALVTSLLSLGALAAPTGGTVSAPEADNIGVGGTSAEKAVAQTMQWHGFYAGLHGGYSVGSSEEVFFAGPNTASFNGTQQYGTNGGFAGGTVGYNWQTVKFVLGLEIDDNWADVNGRSSVINISPSNKGDSYSTTLRSSGNIKGRLGYVAGPMLLFVSGGAAAGEIEHRYDAAQNGGAANTYVQSDTRWGYTVGVGAEYMLTQNWSGKLEYNYIDFGKSTIQYTNSSTNRSEWNDTFHTIKAGINYHFK
jgi:outer membrane immunogenic protein